MIPYHCCGHVSETSVLTAEDVSARAPIALPDHSFLSSFCVSLHFSKSELNRHCNSTG